MHDPAAKCLLHCATVFCEIIECAAPGYAQLGPAVDGLQMRICLAQAAAAQSSIPKLRVEFRNVGEKDLLLNLGIMTGHGAEQYPTAVLLILVDAQGK